MVRRPIRVFAVMALVVVTLTPSASAAPTPVASLVLVGPNAFARNPAAVNSVDLLVTYQCTGGVGTIEARIAQQRPPYGDQVGSGVESIKCDGQQREVPITVNAATAPGFVLARASSSAQVSAPSGIGRDAREIQIVAR
jgi:hypothetical protein